MQLGDLLPYISENENVYIWKDIKLISRYDGRDSIPKEHNKLYICENGIKEDAKGIHILVRE